MALEILGYTLKFHTRPSAADFRWGVISIITELIRARDSLKSHENAQNEMSNNRIEETTAQMFEYPSLSDLQGVNSYLNSMKEFQFNE